MPWGKVSPACTEGRHDHEEGGGGGRGCGGIGRVFFAKKRGARLGGVPGCRWFWGPFSTPRVESDKPHCRTTDTRDTRTQVLGPAFGFVAARARRGVHFTHRHCVSSTPPVQRRNLRYFLAQLIILGQFIT